MARRVAYRDPSTGQWVSAETAFELENAVRYVFGGPQTEQQLLRFGQTEEDLTPNAEANWEQQDSQWGTRWFAEDEGLSLSALAGSSFPEGFDAFRVTYQVPNNPDYPRPYANATWLTPEQWPPDLSLLEGVAPTGIAQIVFRSE